MAYSLFAQDKIDSSWRTNGDRFAIQLTRENNSEREINANLKIFRNDRIVLSNSLSCSMADVTAKDMNGDGFKDLLVYEGSGARSNQRYNLYIYQKEKRNYKRIKGFNLWPNMNTTEIRGVISSMALTGTVEYKFFRITSSGVLVDLKVSVVDENLDGREYDEAIKKLKSGQIQTDTLAKS